MNVDEKEVMDKAGRSKEYNRLEEKVKLEAGKSIWSLTLPVTKTKDPAGNTVKSIDANLFELAKNRIELFCTWNLLENIKGDRTPTGFVVTIPDRLAPSLSTYIRISGAMLSKVGPNRKQRHASNV